MSCGQEIGINPTWRRYVVRSIRSQFIPYLVVKQGEKLLGAQNSEDWLTKCLLDRTDQELAINIKKATNNDEISPKRKHVRACIIYTWDHKSSQAFWAGIKVYVRQDYPGGLFAMLNCSCAIVNLSSPTKSRRSKP